MVTMAAGTGTRSDTGRPETSKAARLRRLWRSQDARVHASGLARARPAPVLPARADEAPARGLTARELINMARAARSGPGPSLGGGSRPRF